LVTSRLHILRVNSSNTWLPPAPLTPLPFFVAPQRVKVQVARCRRSLAIARDVRQGWSLRRPQWPARFRLRTGSHRAQGLPATPAAARGLLGEARTNADAQRPVVNSTGD
jgi:hypothetical protein